MKIMAVINTTPDSFYDGGRLCKPEQAVDYALRCIDDGADILDIGGESTRPGAAVVSLDVEMQRVIPVVEGIRRHNKSIPISVDTNKAAVARDAGEFGIQFVNDVTSLRGDPQMGSTVAELKCNLILMHMQGTPATMQSAPQYKDVVIEVKQFLMERSEFAISTGISPQNLLLDPGIGFGKTVAHNVTLLKGLPELGLLGYPLVVGTSRKSFLGTLTSVSSPEDRLPATLATYPTMLRSQVSIIRVHDVAATKQFLTVLNAL